MIDDQPSIERWPLFEEAYSKFPVLADIEASRIKLARKFNTKPLPREIQEDISWKQHRR